MKNKVFLAPMAGVTDRAYREIATEFCAHYTFTEMVSCKGLYYNDKKTAELLTLSDCEKNASVQIFGHEPDLMAETTEKTLSFGAKYLNINCGCPAKKIISNGDGGALMKNPQLIGDIVSSVCKKSTVPVSVKIRSGYNDESINAVEIAKTAEKNGASMIIIHGRTVSLGYSGASDLNIIREVASSVNIPVIGNGDILTPHDAKKMLDQTNCAGVMIGRGTLGNPYLIRDTVHYLESGELLPPPTVSEQIELSKRHIALIIKYKGEYVGIREARKLAIWYIKGMYGSVSIKNKIISATSYDEMCELLTSLNAFDNTHYRK